MAFWYGDNRISRNYYGRCSLYRQPARSGKKQSRQSLYGKKEGESVKVSLRGDGEELIAFTSRLCMEFPQINGQRSWKDLLMDMVDDFVLRGADGQLAALKAMQKEQTGEYEVYGSPLWNDTQEKRSWGCKGI